ncbi:glycosyltransferase family 4 protein [Polynucleobacter paneuropaeus]|uniref:glycosyltransferase n=1 Tax=Polynucleobacter paneuropaeus TaxID=2527775 RepID=UPI001BFE63E1|nr:glycosyltransferase [Polynucleobacter paneuropaeus]MBT8633211.1 glycosyltransferase family 4 protein [Polynucleobacter paneuropaeus]
MKRRSLIIFLESYVAGGSDQVVAFMLPKLAKYVAIDLFVNKRFDSAVLRAKPLPKNVRIHYYTLVTVAELVGWSRGAKSVWHRYLRRFLGLLIRYPWLLFQAVYFFFRFRALNPSAVWVNNGGYPGGDTCRIATIAASWLGNCRVIHVVHSMAQSPKLLLKPAEWFFDRLLDKSAIFVAVSNAVAKSIVRERAIRQVPVVIFNGLEDNPPQRVESIRAKLNLLQVGCLDRNKNQALSILALGILKRQGLCSVELTLAGKEVEPGYKAELENLAEDLGVSKQVKFSGFIKNMTDSYAQCDLLVLTSFVEGLPLCIIEAMRAGRAVVATRAGGVAELIVDGKTGFLLRNYLPEELATVLQNLEKKKEILVDLGNAARLRYLAEFQLSKQVSRYANLLEVD